VKHWPCKDHAPIVPGDFLEVFGELYKKSSTSKHLVARSLQL